MIEDIKNNIDLEMRMLNEVVNYSDRLGYAADDERKLLNGVIDSLLKRIKFANNSIPGMLKEVSLAQKLPAKEKPTGMEKVYFPKTSSEVVLKKGDKDLFLKELSINESLIKRLKKKQVEKKEKIKEYTRPNLYARMANNLFLPLSNDLAKSEFFKDLKSDLRRSNMAILTTTYISIMLFTTTISFVIGILAVIFLMFFTIGFTAPYIGSYSGSLLHRFFVTFWVAFLVPLLTAIGFYFYPSTEKSSASKKIDQELPFMVIHMASISGSGIEPTQIFKIVGLSREYKNAGAEIRRLINQLNVYGYDIITALKNSAKTTPSQNLAELFNGLASTIRSGGDLKSFFEKRAQTLLLSYRIEREKFAKVAETFMDIYISVVIATPMILLLLLVMISVAGLSTGLGINELTLLIIVAVVFINIIFLTLLGLKQPGY